jgi:tRNA A37 threonylcarbamoyladenosine synthetase subunit TsaC/SUA5/YrdC
VSYYQLTFEPAVTQNLEPVSIIRVEPEDRMAPRKAVQVLHTGGLLIFPTERGYLVGGSALDAHAIQRLRKITGASDDQLVQFAATPEQARQLTGLVQPISHPLPLALMRAADRPIAAGVRPPGSPPWPTAQHAVFAVGESVDLVLDAGRIASVPFAREG